MNSDGHTNWRRANVCIFVVVVAAAAKKKKHMQRQLATALESEC